MIPGDRAGQGEGDAPAGFELGGVYATAAATEAIERAGQSPGDFIRRHAAGDWGEVCAEDAAENELSLRKGYRLLSVYHAGDRKLYVITEADRSATTLMLAGEY